MSFWFFIPILLSTASGPVVPTLGVIDIPPKLKTTTSNPELSGIVWCPPLKRYLVISDDAGLKEDGTKHAPFVLGLDEKGRLDETPIPIIGVDKINDAESICPGPKGSFFLVTSHSPNRSDKTPKTRRQLLHLEVNKRTLKVIGKADLTDVLGAKSLLEIALLPKHGRLDIEAITYHGDALYIGLKSPLTKEGRAVILRLASPEKTTHEGRIHPQALGRFAELPLCISVKNTRVCQGISDMLFLADGSLVLTANAPKGGPSDGGGSLWHVPTPITQSTPELLARFPGEKPEGLAFTSDHRELVIVFDTDRKSLYWTRLPIPGQKASPSPR